MSSPTPASNESTPTFAGLPFRVRFAIWRRALIKSGRERRTKRALFFLTASLMVGLTVAGKTGLLVCGSFGGSLYLAVLFVRMQRHLRVGAAAYRVKHGRS